MAIRKGFVENFYQRALLNGSVGIAANTNFEILGTSAADADSVLATGGGNKLSTAGQANDQIIVVPHLDAGQSDWAGITWLGNGELDYKLNIRVVTTAATIFAAGFRATATLDVGTDNDKVIFRHAAATDGNWHIVESLANADTDTDTGVAFAAGNVELVISIGPQRRTKFYINGVLVRQSSIQLAATTLGVPMFGIQNTGVAVSTFNAQRLGCGINPVA